MLTEFDKALVAIIMGAAYFVNHYTSIHLGFTEQEVSNAIIVLTPVVVWFFPNKQKVSA